MVEFPHLRIHLHGIEVIGSWAPSRFLAQVTSGAMFPGLSCLPGCCLPNVKEIQTYEAVSCIRLFHNKTHVTPSQFNRIVQETSWIWLPFSF